MTVNRAITIEISKGIVVLFAFPDTIIDWVGPRFIIHVPSESEVVDNMNGSIFIKDYESVAGQAAIESVLNDTDLLTMILAHVREIQM